MFELKNGILIHNGKPVFALGQSYYPSYHVQKVPVPPEGDRLGELQQDLQDMAAAGFNIVRMAALGDVVRENGRINVDFPLVDAIIRRAEEVDMATMVRLQGYGVNLSGYTDATMLNENDEEMPFHWGWFVRNCLNHPGILADNEDATVASAAHFRQFPSLVSFQIYNEPAYPTDHFYDYNPHSIRAWQNWLTERGLKTPEEAQTIQPPRRRPAAGEDKSDWINWRLFHYERMNWYLNHLSDKAKAGYALPETLTCHMPCPANPGAILRGEDYFQVAEKMDILGITHYIPSRGPQHYAASEVLDMTESAAATFGKHAWLIEYNAHTKLTANEWERETYSAVGSGFKCIMYYQWRADYPYADGPEPEGFGMVFNNRTKTEKYDRAIAMNRLITEIGAAFACADRVRSGVGILYSENVSAWFDAEDNGAITRVYDCHDRIADYMRLIYRDLRQAGVAVDFTRAADLAANPLGIRLLIVPAANGLSEAETAAINDFAASGPVVLYDPKNFGYKIWANKTAPLMESAGLLDYGRIRPLTRCTVPNLDVKLIAGTQDGRPYAVASLVNFDSREQTVAAGAILDLNLEQLKLSNVQAGFVTPQERKPLICESNGSQVRIVLPEITTGAYLFLTEPN